MELQINSEGSPRVELQFSKAGDRFRNRWTIVFDRSSYDLMNSVEGEDHSGWPLSPPIQDLSHEFRLDHEVILGLGQAGTAHWSSSFQSQPRNSSIFVEHACRWTPPPQDLGCRYEIQPGWSAKQVGQQILLVHDQVFATIELSGCVWTIGNDRSINCRPLTWDLKSPGNPVTVLWSFTVRSLPVEFPT